MIHPNERYGEKSCLIQITHAGILGCCCAAVITPSTTPPDISYVFPAYPYDEWADIVFPIMRKYANPFISYDFFIDWYDVAHKLRAIGGHSKYSYDIYNPQSDGRADSNLNWNRYIIITRNKFQ